MSPADSRTLHYRSVLFGKRSPDGSKSISSMDFTLSGVDSWAQAIFGTLTKEEKKVCFVRVYEVREIKMRDITPV